MATPVEKQIIMVMGVILVFAIVSSSIFFSVSKNVATTKTNKLNAELNSKKHKSRF